MAGEFEKRLNDESTPKALGLVDVVRILWRRKWYLVLSILATIALGVGYLLQLEPTYRAGARVLVQRQSVSTDKERSRSGGAGTVDEFLATQAEIIRSPAVAGRVAASLTKSKPAEPPAPVAELADGQATPPDPVTMLLRNLTVSRVLGTNVLSVGFRSPTGADATRTVQLFIDSYRDYLKEIEHDTYTEVLRMLTRNEEDLRKELARLETDYRDWHAKSPLMGQGKDASGVQRSMLVHLGETLSDVMSNRIQLENQLNSLRQLRDGLKEAVSKGMMLPSVPTAVAPAKPVAATAAGAAAKPAATAARAPAASKPAATAKAPAASAVVKTTAAPAASSPLPVALAVASEVGRAPSGELERIRQALFEAQVRAKELSLTYGQKHPDVRAAKEQVAEWQRRLQESLDIAPMILERQLVSAKDHENQIKKMYDAEYSKAKDIDSYLIREQQALEGIKRVQELHQATLTQLRQWQLADDSVTQGRAGVMVRMLEAPEVAELVVWPPPTMLMGVCVVVGGLGGLGLISILERTDTRVRSAIDVQSQLSLPVYGRIPEMPTARRAASTPAFRSRLVWQAPESLVAEAFRSLRTHLRLDPAARRGTVIQIASPRKGEGKSTVAANLSLSFAQLGKRVVVIDADLRDGGLAEAFGVSDERGLTSVLQGGTPLDAALQRSPVAPVDVLAGGPSVRNPAELLAQPEFDTLLASLRSNYDVVMLDTAPLLLFTDAAVVAPKADYVLMSLTMGRSKMEEAARACELLETLGARCLGVVINQDTAIHRQQYQYSSRRKYTHQDS